MNRYLLRRHPLSHRFVSKTSASKTFVGKSLTSQSWASQGSLNTACSTRTGDLTSALALLISSLINSRSGLLILFSYLILSFSLPVRGQTAPSGTVAPSPAPAAPQPAAPPAGTEARPTLKLGSQGASVSTLQGILRLLGYYTGPVSGSYEETTVQAVAAFQQAAGLQPDGITGTETWNRLLPLAPAILQATQPVQATQPASPAPAPSPATPSPTTGTATPFPAPTPSPVAPSSPTPSPAPSYTPLAPTPAPVTSSTPSPTVSTASGSTLPVLRRGMTGEAVTRLQERLRAIGVFSGAIDGVFGAETEASVQAAQRQYNLEPDGVVGGATWEALLQSN